MIKKFYNFFLLILVISCDRLYYPPKPHGVNERAVFNSKTKMWEYKDEQKEIVWYEDGKIFREAQKKGELYHGKFKQYFRNGKVSQEGIYEEGYRVGTWYYYYPDGKFYLIINYQKEPVSNFFFLNSTTGNENGLYKRFYPGGIIEEEGYFLGGKLHGKRIRYHKNQQLHFVMEYDQGVVKRYTTFHQKSTMD
ncbi:MAG: hypothetical protein RMI35_06195 [Leptospiraceae bacterium]|nr:hypothetical protein [Leptospiraceae bacterium]